MYHCKQRILDGLFKPSVASNYDCRLLLLQQIAFIRWPKSVNHKSVYQNTKQFPKTQINFPKHKLVSQNTNRFLKTQINLSKHEPVCQNTNQFLETQTNFAKHKPINQWTGLLLCNYQRGPGKDSFIGFSVSNMASSVML